MNGTVVTTKKLYVLRLMRGEDVIATLTDFCKKEGITSGAFRAIGAVKNSKIGYYDLEEKKYGMQEYPHDMEVASMTGNVALVDGAPFLHIHTILSDARKGYENQCVGGHVFAAEVAVTLEVHLEAFNESISRTLDADIGLKLLDCGLI